MPVPSKNFTSIPDTSIDANSPITVSLMTQLRDNDIHLEEWLGLGFTAAQNHDHDGVNSAPLEGVLKSKQAITATAFWTKPAGTVKIISQIVGGGGGGGNSTSGPNSGAGAGGGGTAFVEVDVRDRTFVPGDVDTGADTIELGVAVRAVGDKIQLQNTLSDPPAPLAVSTDYWIKTIVSTTKVTLAATKGGSIITLTDQGTGINTMQLIGIDATVGTGGAAAAGGNTSSLDSHASATGGGGGATNGGNGGSGGIGSGGFLNIGGGGGGAADNGLTLGGTGGASTLGGGGRAIGVASAVGEVGRPYGGGGAGGAAASGSQNGGAGADGVVLIWEFA